MDLREHADLAFIPLLQSISVFRTWKIGQKAAPAVHVEPGILAGKKHSPHPCSTWNTVAFAPPQYRLRMVDLCVARKRLMARSPHCRSMRERELCVHAGRVWTCRLINKREPMPMVSLAASNACAFRLQTDNSGSIADLQFRTLPLPPLGDNDVEIAVKGAALNFRDIMVCHMP